MGRIMQFGLFQSYREHMTYIGFQGVHDEDITIYDVNGIVDGSDFRRAIANVFGGNGIDFYYDDSDHQTYDGFFDRDLGNGGLMANGLYSRVESLVLKNVDGKYFYNKDNGREGTELSQMFGENIDVEMNREDFELIVGAKDFFENTFSKEIRVEG